MDRNFRIDKRQLQCPIKLLEDLSKFLLDSSRAIRQEDSTHESPRYSGLGDRAEMSNHHGTHDRAAKSLNRSRKSFTDTSLAHAETDSDDGQQPGIMIATR